MIDFDWSSEKFWNHLNFPKITSEKLKILLRKFSFRDDFFLVGGAIRDTLLGKKFSDLDFTLREDVERFFYFAGKFLGFSQVILSQKFGIYRLAKDKTTIDFTKMRGNSIEEDLGLRDFTFNAIAVRVRDLIAEREEFIDPFNGVKDLREGIIRGINREVFYEDPLRILRGYRFFAEGLGKVEEKTRKYFKECRELLKLCAGERINYELIRILSSPKAYETFKLMDEDGVLEVLFPFVKDCKGVEQPSFHHLDVWGHLLESLKWAEEIIEKPEIYLEEVRDFFDVNLFKDTEFRVVVKLSAFFHDAGKAYTYEFRDRITFYGHEKVSKEIFEEIAERLRFKGKVIEKVGILVKNHMRPFHLLNEKEKGRLTLRAKRNLVRDVPYLLELLVVCLADSYASQGPDKEPDYEKRLIEFFRELFELREELGKQQQKEKRLITGHDLIALGLKPGPVFKEILQEVEILALEGKITTKEQALDFVKNKYCKNLKLS